MKKVLISESDFDRLVKQILSESSIIPEFLKTFIRNMDLAVNGRVNQQIDVLMKKGEIDNFIIVNGVRGKITRPQQILNNLEYLTSKDQKKVFDVIFKNTEDPNEMQVMADFLMGEKDFFLKYRGKTKEQLMSEFTPIYGQKQAQILSDKIIYKNLPKVVWSTFWEMNSEAWASPKLYQTFWKLLKNPLDQKAWGNLMRWFFTGTSRNIGKTFKDYLKLYESFGFSKSACWALARLTASIGLEALQRWVILSGTTTVIKSVVEAVRFQNTPRAEELLTQNGLNVVLDIVGRNWSVWDHSWFFPFVTIVPAVLRFGEGFFKSMSWGEIYDYVINNEYPLVKELISLESRIENKLPFVLS